jgi:hypothetical protein
MILMVDELVDRVLFQLQVYSSSQALISPVTQRFLKQMKEIQKQVIKVKIAMIPVKEILTKKLKKKIDKASWIYPKPKEQI